MSQKTFKSAVGEIVITKRRNSRNIKLAVNYSGVVRVSLPLWLPYKAGLHFANKNEAWIKERFLNLPKRLTHGEQAAQLKKLRQKAELILPVRINLLAAEHGYKFKKLKLRKMTSRWGSCNAGKEITLNIYLAKLPQHLIDYVICHELAHLRVFGHQRAFWDELAKIYPSYKTARKEMRLHKPHID